MDAPSLASQDIETWRQAASGRRRMVLLWFSASVLLLVMGCCTALTQPVLVRSCSNASMVIVEPTRLEAHVRMLSEQCVPRDYTHTDNLDRVAAYIREQFLAAGGRVSEQPFTVRGKTYRNVIARFGPEQGERIVVGAHYDSCEPLPAADDNASGIAGLIELAFLLQKQAPALGVELVAYTLEEPPFFRTEHMGSAVHAKALKAQGVKVRAMLALEMIGYFSDEKGSQEYPLGLLSLFYPSKGNYIAVIGRFTDMGLVRRVKKAMRGATPLPVVSMNAPRSVPGIDFSDHRNYWDAGYRAAMITDSAFYRNHNYHKPTDTANTLDYTRMAQVVVGVHSALMTMDH
jgi:hypothetical protein